MNLHSYVTSILYMDVNLYLK